MVYFIPYSRCHAGICIGNQWSASIAHVDRLALYKYFKGMETSMISCKYNTYIYLTRIR